MRFLGSLIPVIILLSVSLSSVHSQVCTGITPYLIPENNICVIDCPIGYYQSTSGVQQVCLTQRLMRAVVHPTVEERVFILSFSETPVPYTTIQDFTDNVRLTMYSPVQDATVVPISAVFLTESKNLMQITLENIQVIPIQATFRLEFFNFRTNTNSETALPGPAIFTSLAYLQLTEKEDDVIKALTKLDRGLEYAWIAITTLNPYAFLYMNTKLYRETLEMFKRLNVQHGAVADKFLRSNNNKFSGFKAPNMFPIILMDNQVTSGWNRFEENDMIFQTTDLERIQDLEITVSPTVHYYDSSPLFLDNYGIQITVFFAVIVLVIVFEILNLIFRPNTALAKSKVRTLLQAIRIYLRWNLLIASIVGSYQSLIYYIIVQIQALSSEDSSIAHNTLNFWFAIGALIILGIFSPIFVLHKIVSIEKKRRANNAAFETEKEYYGIFFMFYNLDDLKSLTFIFALQIKAVVFAALTLLLYDKPIAQVSVILGLTILFALYLIILRPFSRMIYTIYQLGNELILIGYLAALLFNACQAENEILDDTEAIGSGYFIIALWLLLPTLSIIFGLIGIGMRFAGISTQKPLKQFVPVINASGQRQEEVALSKPIESQEVSEGKAKLSVPTQTDSYVRAAAVHNAETVHTGYPLKETSFHKSVMSLPHLDIVDEEVEREQGSGTPKEYNQSLPNFYKSNSQIMTPIHAASFDRVHTLNESKETIPEFRGILALPKLSTSRGSQILVDVGDLELSRRGSYRRPMSNSVSFDRKSMESRKSVDMERRRSSAMYTHESRNNFAQKTRPNRSCCLSPSNAGFGAKMTNRSSILSSVPTNRARFYEEDEGFKKFKERFTLDEL